MKINAADLAKALQALDYFAEHQFDLKVPGLGWMEILDARINIRYALQNTKLEVQNETE